MHRDRSADRPGPAHLVLTTVVGGADPRTRCSVATRFRPATWTCRCPIHQICGRSMPASATSCATSTMARTLPRDRGTIVGWQVPPDRSLGAERLLPYSAGYPGCSPEHRRWPYG